MSSAATRRILIVSPHFPPVNAPDMQRVRLALPHLRARGWEPVVLAVTPDSVEGAVLEPLLEETYPADIRVLRVRGVSPRLTRPLGFGSLWWRCGGALRHAGDALLASERFDLVFFSTTQFDAFTLGPRWLRRFGIPYVLDYQDPWVNDYYRKTNTRPPGGPFKFRLSQAAARRREPAVLDRCSRVVSVSNAYGPELCSRYPWFDASRVVTLPFGTSPADLEIARRHPPSSRLVPFGDGHIHHVYTGRCGPDMTIALTVLFRAFARFRASHPREAERHRFHFIGTDYAPPPLGRHWALPIAEIEGVLEHVREHCYRVPYFDALHFLANADALLVVGSNDPSYSASKIFPYLMARRPLIAIAHENGPMLRLLLQQEEAASVYGFLDKNQIDPLAERVWTEWFVNGGFSRPVGHAPRRLAEHDAAAMTTTLASVFDAAVSGARFA